MTVAALPGLAAVTRAAHGARAAWLLRRVGRVVVVVWAVYTLTFFLLYALPSDPVAIMLERRSLGAGATSPDALRTLTERYGYDRPPFERYLRTLGGLLTGDAGVSFSSGRPVWEVVGAVAGSTLALAVGALLIAVPLAVGLALLTSWRTGGAVHRLLVGLPALIAAIPAFWLGLLLLQVFAFQLRWLPSSGGTSLAQLVLPSVALAIPVSAALTAVLVRGLDEVSRAGWVALLRSRGLPWRRIYLAHVVRNASLPFVTLAGLTVAGVLVGTVITETVFSRSGLGRLLVTSVETQDAPVVLALTTGAALVFVLVNLAVDLVYPLLDPRVRRAEAAS